MTTEGAAADDLRRAGLSGSALLVFVASLVTMGVFLPIWYLMRRQGLNRLDGDEQMGTTAPVVALGLSCLSASGMFSVFGGASLESTVLLSGLNNLVTLAIGGILVVLRLKVRRMLMLHAERRSGEPLGVSWLGAAVLGEFYLQAKVNLLVQRCRPQAWGISEEAPAAGDLPVFQARPAQG